MIGPSSGDAFARRLAATAGRGAVRFRRATFPLMGGKVSGLNLHSRLTGEVHLAGVRKYWRRAMPARISAAGFSCPVGVGFCTFWVVAARLLMSLPGVSSIAAGWQLCSAPPRYLAFGPRPISSRMHLQDPVRFER